MHEVDGEDAVDIEQVGAAVGVGLNGT
jgi:hypothetical protein